MGVPVAGPPAQRDSRRDNRPGRGGRSVAGRSAGRAFGAGDAAWIPCR